MQPLNNLATFISIVKNQKLKVAADELSITESAVSHQLSRLEDRLNVKLLNRSSKGVSLTADGKTFYDQIAPAMEAIDKALYNLQTKKQKIVLTMPQSFAALWFSQRLYRLEIEFPEIEFEIRPTQRLCNLEEEGVDLGIRTYEKIPENKGAIVLTQELLTPVCSAKMYESIQNLSFEQISLQYGIVLNNLHKDEWNSWCFEQDFNLKEKVRIRKLDTFDLISNAALHDLGIAMGRTPLIDFQIKMGWLVKPYPNKIIKGQWYTIEQNKRTNKSKEVDDLIEWLVAELE